MNFLHFLAPRELGSEWGGVMGGRREEWYVGGQSLGDTLRSFLGNKDGDYGGLAYRERFGSVRITIEVAGQVDLSA